LPQNHTLRDFVMCLSLIYRFCYLASGSQSVIALLASIGVSLYCLYVLYTRLFSARQHNAIACYMLSPVRPNGVRLSVTRVDQSKTVEVRIMQPSRQSSPMTVVS